MTSEQAVPSLMAFTIGAVLLIAIGALIWFLRSRRNRQIMGDVLEGKTAMDTSRVTDNDTNRLNQ